VRGIIKDNLLYLRNYETDRWPTGNPETGYLNCDGGPTKTWILEAQRRGEEQPYWQWGFGKRGAEEMFDLAADPDCLHNLMDDPAYVDRGQSLQRQMVAELKAEGDPRMFGQGHLFDEYEIAQDNSRGYYERYMSGQAPKAGWVSPGDYELTPLDDNGKPIP
jgi:hypothetical protein